MLFTILLEINFKTSVVDAGAEVVGALVVGSTLVRARNCSLSISETRRVVELGVPIERAAGETIAVGIISMGTREEQDDSGRERARTPARLEHRQTHRLMRFEPSRRSVEIHSGYH